MIKIQEEREGFIKFDKKFIQEKQTKNRLLLIMAYLKIYASVSGHVGVSINLLVNKIGYKPDRHVGKINEKTIDLLKDLETKGHLYILTVTDELNSNECFIAQINSASDLFYPEKDYVLLTENEFTTITQSKVKCDKQDLLNVYLNIKKFINMGKDSDKLCYPSHTTLCRDCKISSTGTMNKIIDALIVMGVLFTYNSGRYEDGKGNLRFANSFYALEDGVLKPEKCDEIIKNYYSSQGIIVEKFIKAKENL